MQDAQVIARIRRKYRSLEPELDERRRRQWAAAEARDLGWGGVTAVAQATGLSREPPHELIGRGETGAVTRAFAEEKGGTRASGWTR
jgi:hypothetical protein